jgi:hypothetical protein
MSRTLNDCGELKIERNLFLSRTIENHSSESPTKETTAEELIPNRSNRSSCQFLLDLLQEFLLNALGFIDQFALDSS